MSIRTENIKSTINSLYPTIKVVGVLFFIAILILSFLPTQNVQAQVTTFFTEDFENTSFGSRGWYDNTATKITTTEHQSGTAAAQYRWVVGGTTPITSTATGGSGSLRHKFTPSDSIYVSYWVKYSSNWIGSSKGYHPHEFTISTTEDGDYAGLAYTRLTGYIEHNYKTVNGVTGGVPLLALQDGRNIDLTKLNQNLVGVTENRAIAGCNGIPANYGQFGNAACYPSGSVYWNGVQWMPNAVYFDSNPSSPNYKNNWHHVEAYFQLNTITSGIANSDGILQYWFDDQLVINRTNVYLRTGLRPNMKFNQFDISPWIGDGSPVDQTMWVDNLSVGNMRPGGSSPPPPPPPPTPVSGDINLDHIVNAIDYSLLNSDWFTTNSRSDLNTDGIVNSLDYSILNSNWFKTW